MTSWRRCARTIWYRWRLFGKFYRQQRLATITTRMISNDRTFRNSRVQLYFRLDYLLHERKFNSKGRRNQVKLLQTIGLSAELRTHIHQHIVEQANRRGNYHCLLTVWRNYEYDTIWTRDWWRRRNYGEDIAWTWWASGSICRQRVVYITNSWNWAFAFMSLIGDLESWLRDWESVQTMVDNFPHLEYYVNGFDHFQPKWVVQSTLHIVAQN